MLRPQSSMLFVLAICLAACSDNAATQMNSPDLLVNENARAWNIDGTQDCEDLEITPEEIKANEGLDPSSLEPTRDLLDIPWWQTPRDDNDGGIHSYLQDQRKHSDGIQEDNGTNREKAEFHQILPKEKHSRHFCAWHLGAGPLCSYYKEFHQNMWWKHIKKGEHASLYRGYKKVP